MNPKRWVIGVLLLTATTGAIALFAFLQRTTGKPISGLKSPERLVLYSIDGTKTDFRPDQASDLASAVDTYGGCPILGKLEVADKKESEKLVAALQNAIAHPDGMAYKCFWPRHAILAVENGQTFEIVICFQCRQYMLNGRGYPLISKRPEAMFNDYLRQHNIAIAP
jgi:hypothetical protein